MSHLDAALRRAAADRGRETTRTELSQLSAIDPAAGRPEFSAAEEAPAQEERRSRAAQWLHERDARVEAKAPFPPEVASQLGNLVESLALRNPSPRIIGFASSGRGEGTSTSVAMLGAYLAGRNATVLLVDANPHHPSLHTIAKVDERPGLSELVAGDIDLRAAATPTALPDLFILTNGASASSSSGGEVVPAAIHERLLQYATIFDYVLVDCPPINAYGDAAAIAAACEAVILVIDGNHTRREAAVASKALLARANCSILGVFMNKRKFHIPQFLYDRL